MNDKVNKYAYYLNFPVEKFLAGKELLKSMPVFFNRVYFCKKYANLLWNGDSDDIFSDITIYAKKEDIKQLRQIIKNNFLYLQDWDSIKFTDKDDYGFVFIAGNIKYNVFPFEEIDDGYIMYSYEPEEGKCTKTTLLNADKKFFLDASINDRGEFVRTVAFNLEDINEKNSESFIAEKKTLPQMALYDKRGSVGTSALNIIGFMILALVIVWVVYLIMKLMKLA